MPVSPAAALATLRRMAETGELDRFCEAQELDLLVVFGSVLQADTYPADLDIAVRFAAGSDGDVIRLIRRWLTCSASSGSM